MNDYTVREYIEKSQTSDTVVVILFVKNCSLCDAFRPTFYHSVHEHADQEIDFGELNCLKHEKICDELNLTEFPSLVVFKDGKDYLFKNEKNLENLRNFF